MADSCGEKRAVKLPVTIGVLFYGDFPRAADNFLSSLYDNTAESEFNLIIGANEVGKKTRKLVETVRSSKKNVVKSVDSPTNILKYPMMRRMFYEDDGTTRDPAVSTDWLFWFDDDSYVTSSLWLPSAINYISEHKCGMIGKKYFVRLSPGQVSWLEASKWWLGKPISSNSGSNKVHFATGGYWGIESKLFFGLDWPDRRLSHNGGDMSLGEALRQRGIGVGNRSDHVMINKMPRRGISQKYPEIKK